MALIGSLTTTGSMTATVVDEARWKVANDDGTSPGSVSLVVQTGDFGNATQRNASGSIIFVGKDGGATNKAGSIVSKPYTNQDLVFSSSQSHADIRFAVNDGGTNFNLMTITSGRSGGGLSANRGPKVFITDTAGGYDKGTDTEHRGQGLLTISTQTDQLGVQILHTGTASESALEVKGGTTNSTTLFSVKQSETVVNDGSADYDFRVESNGQTNMLYVDGTNNRVGVGNNAPMAALDVNDTGGTYALLLRRNDNSGVATSFAAISMGGQGQAYFTGSNGKFHFYGGTDSNQDGQVFIAGKAQASNPGDSRLWFSTLNATDSKTDVYHMGYDRGEQKFILGNSSTWGANSILTVDDKQIVINSGSQDLDFIVQSDDNTHTFMVDANNNKVYIGEDTIAPHLTDAAHGKLTVSHSKTDTWDMTGGSANGYDQFQLVIRNETVTSDAFAGVAFDVSTEKDPDSIGAAIVATRDTSASSTAGNHDTNLVFATNDAGDDGCTERMRITHDGKVIIGSGLGSDYTTGTGCMLLSTTANAATDVGDPANYHLYIHHGANTNSNAAGIAFSISESINDVGAAIIHTRTGSESKGTLSLYVKSSTTDGADPIEALAIAATGVITTYGNLTTGGDIQVNGNDVKDSGGNSVITFGGSSGAQFNGHLKVLRAVPILSLRDNDATNETEFCGYIDFYQGDGTSRVGWFGYGTTANSSMTIKNEVSDGVIYFATDTGTAVTINNDMSVTFNQIIVGDYSNNLNMQSNGGYVFIKSDTSIYMDLDEDSDDTDSQFKIRNGANSNVFVVNESNGWCGVGHGTPTEALHVYESLASAWAMRIEHQGNDPNRYGLVIQCGDDAQNNSGIDNYYIYFRDGNDDFAGGITGNNGTVTYSAFTGVHPARIPDGVDGYTNELGNHMPGYPYGTLMKIESVSQKGNAVEYECDRSSAAKQKGILGVYGCHHLDDPYEDMRHLHDIWSIGDGHILVCSEGGNIELGDYICSSSTPGYGMLQDDDLLHNYTVAKASEPVDWSSESETTKLIACTYHCG